MYVSARQRIERMMFPVLFLSLAEAMAKAPLAVASGGVSKVGQALKDVGTYAFHEALQGLDRSSQLRLAERNDRIVEKLDACYSHKLLIVPPLDPPAHRFITNARLLKRLQSEKRFAPPENTLLARFVAAVLTCIEATDMEYDATRGDLQIDRMLAILDAQQVFPVLADALDPSETIH